MADSKNPIETFDYMYTTNHIQIMKMALPYLSEKIQPFLAVMIKYMELTYTFSLISQPVFHPVSANTPEQQLSCFFKDIQTYLTESEQKQLLQIQSLINNMEQMKQMQEMMKMFDSFQGNDSNSYNSYFSDFDQYMKSKSPDKSASIYPFQRENAQAKTATQSPFSSPINMLSMLKSASSDNVTNAINTIFPPDS